MDRSRQSHVDVGSDGEPDLSYLQMFSLSDSDRIKNSSPNAVLVCDATRQTIEPNRTEVDVIIEYGHSPIRVINHSPGAVMRNLAKKSDHEQLHQIPVPQVLTVSATDYNNAEQSFEKEHRDKDLDLSPGLADVDAMSPIMPPSGKQSGTRPKSVVVQKESDIESRKTTGNNSVMDQSKIKKKKKATRVIQSRYLSAGNKSITDTSIQQRSMVKKSTKQEQQKQQSRSHLSSTRNMSAYYNTTRTRIGSAPSISDVSRISVPSDLSTVSDSSAIYKIAGKARMPQNSTATVKTPVGSKMKTKKEKSSKYTTKDLDAMYSRYIQWRFLRLKLEKSAKQREKHATSLLHSLWEQVEQNRLDAAKLEVENITVNMTNRLFSILDVLDEALPQVIEKIPTFREQHKVLAHSLDAIRHQIPTDGIYLPADKEKYENDLSETLDSTLELMSRFKRLLNNQEADMNKTANYMSVLKETTEKEFEQMKLCKDLVTEGKSALLQELSMNIQDIEERESF